jgi:hypothetical protein
MWLLLLYAIERERVQFVNVRNRTPAQFNKYINYLPCVLLGWEP